MEKPARTVNQNRSLKQPAAKSTKHKHRDRAMKVVYITNPMRFKTSVSEFRSLVQELTGKDSDISETLAKYESSLKDRPSSCIDSAISNAGLDQAEEVDGPMDLFDEAFEKFPWFMSSFADLNSR